VPPLGLQIRANLSGKCYNLKYYLKKKYFLKNNFWLFKIFFWV
jgi:hypothetical protein